MTNHAENARNQLPKTLIFTLYKIQNVI